MPLHAALGSELFQNARHMLRAVEPLDCKVQRFRENESRALIESDFDYCLQLRQFFIPRVLFLASITFVCLQLYVDISLRISRASLASYCREQIGPFGGVFRN